jgi:xanthosine utilization system XapX-like protein
VPVILITGCLAGVVFSFMKSSPTPFIIAFITTVSFGFAKTWIGGTYTVVV